ncbi:hypothetical protein [Phocaeicola sp.]
MDIKYDFKENAFKEKESKPLLYPALVLKNTRTAFEKMQESGGSRSLGEKNKSTTTTYAIPLFIGVLRQTVVVVVVENKNSVVET